MFRIGDVVRLNGKGGQEHLYQYGWGGPMSIDSIDVTNGCRGYIVSHPSKKQGLFYEHELELAPKHELDLALKEETSMNKTDSKFKVGDEVCLNKESALLYVNKNGDGWNGPMIVTESGSSITYCSIRHPVFGVGRFRFDELEVYTKAETLVNKSERFFVIDEDSNCIYGKKEEFRTMEDVLAYLEKEGIQSYVEELTVVKVFKKLVSRNLWEVVNE